MPLCFVHFYFYYLVHLELFWWVSFNLNFLSFTNRQFCKYSWLRDPFSSQWFLGCDECVYVLDPVLLSFSVIPYVGTLMIQTGECGISPRMASALIFTLTVQRELQVEVWNNLAHLKNLYWDFDRYVMGKLRYIWENWTSL